MKKILIILLSLLTFELFAQNKKKIFYDSIGQLTTFEGHWAQVVTGKYKSIYNKAENKKTLVKTTREEFETELRKTEKRITLKNKIGADFPEFDLMDINGDQITKSELKGKILVVNFWFIGCAPCEMERPALNELTKIYKDNKDVIFISFARNDKEQLTNFLTENQFLYKVIPTDKDFIKTKFEINQYPFNIIVDRNGRYYFNSSPTGIGIITILQKHIDNALKQ